MDALRLEARPRTERGRHVRALRRQGLVPAIVYGHGQDPLSIAVDYRDLERVWHRAGRTHLVDLEIGEERPRRALIRELQRDPRSWQILHADFYVVDLREKLSADIPVVCVGESPAVQQRLGQLVQPVTEVRVECLPAALPAQITVDVSGLTQVDEAITVGELSVPEGVAIVHPPADEVVVKVGPTRVREEAAPVTPAAEAEGGGGAAPSEEPAGADEG